MMHKIQEKLLMLSKERNLGQHSLRQIGEMVGGASPQTIKHHLNQLEKKGLIRVDKAKGLVEKTKPGWAETSMKNARLLVLPILGGANAGPAVINAEENIEGYLRVSNSIVGRKSGDGLFALRVSGPSMNKASFDGKTIEDGDYIIVDGKDRSPRDGDIVLSVIDRMANVKRFHFDKDSGQIALVSESTQNFPPIYMHQSDDYMINGKVVQVIKKPKTNSQPSS
ncbi:MAG: S24 family peptidase [Minisyncoccia bacterium]|jgi:repressor LexA